MEERRKYKSKDLKKYKEIQNNIRKKICEAKEKWLFEKCREIEEV